MFNVQLVISRIPAWQDAQSITFTRLAGLTNENYRVMVDGEYFVLRISGKNTGFLGIDRNSEWAALQTASAAGIAPPVVAYLEPEGHLVTRWVNGRHWSTDEFRTVDHVRLLTETVKRIHALPANGSHFSPFRRVESYLKTAQNLGVLLPTDLDDLLQTMSAIEADQKADPSDWLRFCHNDLVSVNYLFVEDDQSIKILDWEFAGLGDIYYDLATLVYTHDSDGPISEEMETTMLDCYFGEIIPRQRRRLLGMKYMLMLFSGMWGLAQYGMQQTGLISPVEGFDYQDFALFLFANDVRELQSQLRNTTGNC